MIILITRIFFHILVNNNKYLQPEKSLNTKYIFNIKFISYTFLISLSIHKKDIKFYIGYLIKAGSIIH